MRPAIGLDSATLRENARAWRLHAGVPLRAVVKSDAYGWGFETVVPVLEDLVDAFVVADAEEFDRVRGLTKHPIVTLADTAAGEIGRLLGAGAIPNVATPEGLAAARVWAKSQGRRARIRVGLRPAVGWAGFDFEALLHAIPLLCVQELEIELWTHLTEPEPAAAQRSAFAAAELELLARGVALAATDIESTRPLAAAGAVGSYVRVGIGLFGARFGGELPGVRCALRVEAPVVRRLPSTGQAVGYGTVRAPSEGYLEVVRCGYGDGFVRVTGTVAHILTVGMQYTVLWRGNSGDHRSVVLLDAESDLDEMALAAGVGPHELVVRLGMAARNRFITAETHLPREQS